MSFLFQMARLLALVFAIAVLTVVHAHSDDDDLYDLTADASTNRPSVVTRLDPVLKKALLRALSNLEVDHDDSTEDISLESTTTVPAGDDLFEESTAADLQALNLYNAYITEGGTNFTQRSSDDSEIIHTIIVKAPKTTANPVNKDKDDQVIIRFGNPDPVKDSDVQVHTVQVTRSVSSNEIGNEIGDEDRITTYKPRGSVNYFTASTSTTSTTPSTTTTPEPTTTRSTTTRTPATTTTTFLTTTTPAPAPTHDADGVNIEKVEPNDVKIFQAPLVAAFTVQQDARGQPKNVIPIVRPVDPPPSSAQPVQEFALSSTAQGAPQLQQQQLQQLAPSPTPLSFEASTADVRTTRPTAEPTQAPASVKPFLVSLQQSRDTPGISLSQSLELPTTKEAAFSTFALEQKRKQLEEQIALLQQQQRHQEELFRQQQLLHEQQAFSRQQQLLLAQRLRYEEESRLRQQRFEQEQRLYRNQLQLQTRYPLTQLPQQLNVPSVQIIPSLSFPPVQIATQQLLPVREAAEFGPKNPDIPAQTLFPPTQQIPQQGPPLLSTVQQPPLRPAQPFFAVPITPDPILLQQTPPPLPPQSPAPIDPTLIAAEQSQSRNRVFRQESGAGNFGINAQFNEPNPPVNTQFPPIFPVFNADNQLQNLLLQNGYSGRSNEELNIISKVLALNHGIAPPQSNFIIDDPRRFARSTSSAASHSATNAQKH